MKLHDINLEEGRWKNLAMAGALLGAGMGVGSRMHKAPAAAPNKPSAYQQAFHSKAQEAEKQQLRDKAQQLRDKGLTKGTFVHGKLQEPKTGGTKQKKSTDNSKRIESSSVTSDAAADFLQ
jgi:hypothetical protein